MTLEKWADALAYGMVDIFAEINTRSGKPPVVKVTYHKSLMAATR